MWANLRHTLTAERHQTLDRRLGRLGQLLVNDENVSASKRDQDLAEFAHATGNGLVEVLRPDGTTAYASPTLAASSFPWPELKADGRGMFVRATSDKQTYWVLARPLSLAGQSLVLIAAAPDAGNLLVIENFLWGLLASAPPFLVISSAGGYWLSRRALKPVDRITEAARSISIHNVSERIPVSQTGDELQRLAETCNAMFDRLESSVNQIKRFTADASHELRGPLSFTRTVAECALKNPQADQESRGALNDIVEEMAKAAILLEEMLTLARADSGPVALPRTPVDLASLTRGGVRDGTADRERSMVCNSSFLNLFQTVGSRRCTHPQAPSLDIAGQRHQIFQPQWDDQNFFGIAVYRDQNSDPR